MVHHAEIIAEHTTKITDLENEVAQFSRPVQYIRNQALFNQCKAQDSSKMVPKVCISQEKQPPSIDCGCLIGVCLASHTWISLHKCGVPTPQ